MRKILFITSFLFPLANLQATPSCSQGHCGRVHTEMNVFCVQNGMAGKPFMVFGPDGSPCMCPCSCVTPDTAIELLEADATFGTVQLADQAITPMASETASNVDLKLSSTVSEATIYVLKFSNGATLKTSANHTFISEDERTITAAELKLGDHILDSNLKPTALLSSQVIADYSGELINVVTSSTSHEPADHVIATNGVLSGDWLLQATSDSVATGVAIRSGQVATYR